jgi:hypothetical protein
MEDTFTIKPSLQDKGCTWPECQCEVPYWAFSQDVRKKFCKIEEEHKNSKK